MPNETYIRQCGIVPDVFLTLYKLLRVPNIADYLEMTLGNDAFLTLYSRIRTIYERTGLSLPEGTMVLRCHGLVSHNTLHNHMTTMIDGSMSWGYVEEQMNYPMGYFSGVCGALDSFDSANIPDPLMISLELDNIGRTYPWVWGDLYLPSMGISIDRYQGNWTVVDDVGIPPPIVPSEVSYDSYRELMVRTFPLPRPDPRLTREDRRASSEGKTIGEEFL